MQLTTLQDKWATDGNQKAYTTLVAEAFDASAVFPVWYLLLEDDQIIGCAGLIETDFIHRKDLCPWLCSLFIEEAYRGKSLGSKLIRRIQQDAVLADFSALYLSALYLCIHHSGYYEKFGFQYIGKRCQTGKRRSNIYQCLLNNNREKIEVEEI